VVTLVITVIVVKIIKSFHSREMCFTGCRELKFEEGASQNCSVLAGVASEGYTYS